MFATSGRPVNEYTTILQSFVFLNFVSMANVQHVSLLQEIPAALTKASILAILDTASIRPSQAAHNILLLCGIHDLNIRTS